MIRVTTFSHIHTTSDGRTRTAQTEFKTPSMDSLLRLGEAGVKAGYIVVDRVAIVWPPAHLEIEEIPA